MTRTLLIALGLLLVSTTAFAEPKLTVRVDVNGPAVTASDVTEEDLESGKLEELLSKAVRQAKRVWMCDLANRC